MMSLKVMDELLWGKEFEDVIEWIERLEMVTQVRNYDEIKLFKITRLNLKGKVSYLCLTWNISLSLFDEELEPSMLEEAILCKK